MRATFTKRKKRRNSDEGGDNGYRGANDGYRPSLLAGEREEKKGKFSDRGKSDADKRKDRKKKEAEKKKKKKEKNQKPRSLFQRCCKCCMKSSKVGDKPQLKRENSATQIERLVRGFNARRKMRKVIEEKRAKDAANDDAAVFDIEEFESVKKERDDLKKEVEMLKRQLVKLATEE